MLHTQPQASGLSQHMHLEHIYRACPVGNTMPSMGIEQEAGTAPAF